MTVSQFSPESAQGTRVYLSDAIFSTTIPIKTSEKIIFKGGHICELFLLDVIYANPNNYLSDRVTQLAFGNDLHKR